MTFSRLLSFLLLPLSIRAFTLSRSVGARGQSSPSLPAVGSKSLLRESADGSDPLEEFSEERKANLFQFLLRDLEIEGVPLLGCDADQTSALQAALWTTMAELNEKDLEEKACLVLESISIDDLRVFVDDFMAMKEEDRLMEQLPELSRFNVSLVGRGVGPAILIESGNRTKAEQEAYQAMMAASPEPNELTWQASMKTFVSRMMGANEVCPHISDNSVGPTGLESEGIQSGPIAYRLVGSSGVCDTMSAFWTCMCEILALPEDALSSTVMCLPPVVESADRTKAHSRFGGLSELISRSLFLYHGESMVDLWHMHPFYDRDSIFPVDKPQHGHLPPMGWIRPMIRASGHDDAELSDEQIRLQNYQRRSPLPAVVMKRVSQLDAAETPENGAVEIELDDEGRVIMESEIETCTRNVLRLAKEGEEPLKSALEKEIALTES